MESDRLSNTLSDGTRDGQQRGRPLHGRTSGPTRRSTKGQWTAEEDEILRMAVQRFKGKNWKKIAECFKDRTDVQCLHRWQKVLNPDLVKGPWSKEEDEIIIQMVDKYGPKKWSTIAQHLPGRIGKQCRERWHNHLNPNINKEAWTQEEELALIRAHQVYGNKWAELTKYLPGRTDNSIKNHWNSSVKKKLDMYLASGLLSQFQGQPLVTMVNQSAASSSSRVQQNSEDDSIPKEKIEMEEASECSQGSAINRAAHPIADCRANEESGPFMRSEDYRPVFQEDTFGCETSENFLEHGLSLDWGKFAGTDWEFNSTELPDMSLLDLGQESSDPFMPSLNGTDSHGTGPILPETSMAVAPLTCRTNMVASNNTPNLPANSDNRVLYSDNGHDGYLPSENMCTQATGLADSLLQSNYQTLEDQNFLPQSFYMTSDMLENSFTQTFPIPTQLSYNDSQVMISQDTNGGHYPSLDNIEQESNPPNTHEGFIPGSIPCEDNSNEANGSPKRVQANDFVLAPSNDSQCDTSKEKDMVQTDEQDPGSISYNPPRFPSLDMPFFSCDLIQSGTDLHQDYSPLGIRQLMISSSLTPFKLWDSPSRDDSSPDAVLRNAAKTFTGTPSILKKRSRDLVSPLSEKRSEKKKERSNLRNNSRLGALFDECVEMKEVVASPDPKTEEEFEEDCSDKENMAPVHTEGVKDERGKDEMQKEHKSSGILQEHDMNDLIFLSPDRFGIKNDRAMGLSARALGNRYSKRLEAASTNGAFFSAAENSSFSVVCSPRLSNKKDGTSLVIASTSLQSLSPSAKKVESSGNCAVSENNSIFFDTPFRRSMESPSGWKSPWLFGTTFVPGPRVDTDITIEDIGYLLSPGDRSYDAIGLMKQLGEQTARAFADAQEVLGDETPDTIMKTQNPNSGADLQNLITSQSMTERRTLDFSECGTPVKQTENISSCTGHSSPSTSYLLKSCR